MLYMTVTTWPPENRDAIVKRFIETGGKTPPGVKLLGRWHDSAGGRSFTLTESDDPVAMGKSNLMWNDLMSFEVIPVGDDEVVAKVLAG